MTASNSGVDDGTYLSAHESELRLSLAFSSQPHPRSSSCSISVELNVSYVGRHETRFIL